MLLEFRGTKGKKIEVYADEEFYCRCYPKDLRSLGISDCSEGMQEECSEERLSLFEAEVFLPRAKRRGLFLLEKKEYTEAELRKKLFSDGYPVGTVDKVMSYVKELHYINDRSFAERYALYLLPRYSEQELLQKMYVKGFDKELIKEALDAAKETYRYEHEHMEEERAELVAIRSFLRKKGYHAETADEEKKKKVVAALCRKGFSYGDIKEVMGTLETSDEMFDLF